MKLITRPITNVNIKLFSLTFKFRKVVRQQISGEVLILIQASSIDPFNDAVYFYSSRLVNQTLHTIILFFTFVR